MAARASRSAAAKPMRRLLRVLDLEEEQMQRALEAATEELRHLERAREVACERERQGRALIGASATSGQIADRVAGLEEIRQGQRAASALASRITEAQAQATARRKEYLAKRIERQQAETLVRAAEAREAREAAQREQRSLDDWFLGEVLRARRGERERTGSQFDWQDGEGQVGNGLRGERQHGENAEAKPIRKN